MADDVVLYDACGDAVAAVPGAVAGVLRGKPDIGAFAARAHELMGSQLMLASAAAENSNVAFAHFAVRCLALERCQAGV